jgi:hypothetical protein
MTLNNLPEGAHTFSVTQTDAESNVSPAGSVSWTVDTLDPGAPTVTRTAPTATPTNSTTQSLSFSGAEAGGSFQCKLDSAAYSPCPSSPLTLNGLPDGSHTYSVTQTDAAGNVGPAGTASWTTDLVGPAAPTVTRTAPSASPTTSDSQTVVYAGEPGGTFECQLDSEPIEICEAGPLTFTGLSLGYHSFLVRQTDDAGNLGAVGVTAWTITTVPPDPTGPSGPIDPTGSTGPPPPPDPDPPVVPTATLSSVTPKSIVPARTGGPFSLKSRGSAGSFRVKLSAASAVSVRLERVVAGGTRAAAGWTKLKLKSGQTTIYLSGRANGRALPAGIYKVRLTVGGAKPNVLGKSFRIKR